MWAARCTRAFVHLYKNSRERVPVRYNKKRGGCRSFILFVFPQYCCCIHSYSLRLWAHSMCKTVQSNDLFIVSWGKKRLQLQSGTYKNWQKDLLMEGRRKTHQWKGSKKFEVKTKNWNGLYQSLLIIDCISCRRRQLARRSQAVDECLGLRVTWYQRFRLTHFGFWSVKSFERIKMFQSHFKRK